MLAARLLVTLLTRLLTRLLTTLFTTARRRGAEPGPDALGGGQGPAFVGRRPSWARPAGPPVLGALP